MRPTGTDMPHSGRGNHNNNDNNNKNDNNNNNDNDNNDNNNDKWHHNAPTARLGSSGTPIRGCRCAEGVAAPRVLLR